MMKSGLETLTKSNKEKNQTDHFANLLNNRKQTNFRRAGIVEKAFLKLRFHRPINSIRAITDFACLRSSQSNSLILNRLQIEINHICLFNSKTLREKSNPNSSNPLSLIKNRPLVTVDQPFDFPESIMHFVLQSL